MFSSASSPSLYLRIESGEYSKHKVQVWMFRFFRFQPPISNAAMGLAPCQINAYTFLTIGIR